MNAYVERVIAKVKAENVGEAKYIQAVEEILPTLSPVFDAHPEYEKQALLERFVEPERVILFRVPWVDDNGVVHVNKGYRVQFNSAIGVYKGGLRFHPSVNLSTFKFLALEQTLKNSLTSLPLGGAKGGADFDPKGKSDGEIMRFCQSYMQELYRHIGEDTDVPAGDIGVGAREIGYLFGEYKRLTATHTGVITGRGLSFGGSLLRTEAAGYGLVYISERALSSCNETLKGKTAVVSGSGNVAIYAAEKLIQKGAKVVAMSDSDGYIYDENGIDVQRIKELKEVRRGRIKEYAEEVKTAKYTAEAKKIWTVKADLMFPCATENEIDEASAKAIVKNKPLLVAEGANMPSDLNAIRIFEAAELIFLPAKAANAGGVAVSGLEMVQSSMRVYWTKQEVDDKLQEIMQNIFDTISKTAEKYNQKGDYLLGANIAGFEKVADAMTAQGIV